MSIKLTSEEKRLVEYSKKAIVKYNTIRHKKGGIDMLKSHYKISVCGQPALKVFC